MQAYALRCILLLCTTFLVSAAPTPPPSAASFYVKNVPGLQLDPSKPPLHIWSGHLLSESNNPEPASKDVLSHLFFVLIKARRSADKERLIFWFNGGPGCSSFDGLMMETGPWRMDGPGKLKLIDGGWDEYTNVVYIDQPVGTGFSYGSTGKYVEELTDMAPQMVEFLRNFYQVFPEFSTVDTYLAGESFAGQYIPYIADAILDSNLPTPLKGLAIGNGWIDSKVQYPAYIEFGLKAGLIKENDEVHIKSKEAMEFCQKDLDKRPDWDPVSVGSCESVMGTVLQGFDRKINGVEMCMNIYDIRLSDTMPACGMNWPPDLADVTQWLRKSEVVTALHADHKQEAWTECSGRVGAVMVNRKSPSSITLLPVLAAQVPVLLFAGDQDVICNYVGQERILEKMRWNGARGMGDSETLPWVVNGTDAGTWRTARNVTYVKVYGASHMVGFDVPLVAHDMMLRFMGVDFDKLTEGTARIPSSVGTNFKSGELPATTKLSDVEEKAKWEAYYNAGTAALVVVLIALAVGLFFYCRSQRRVRLGVNSSRGKYVGVEEESIPLNPSMAESTEESRRRKGKGRALPADEDEPVFEIGSDGEEKYPS